MSEIEEYDDAVIVPQRIGVCNNAIDLFYQRGVLVNRFCGRAITDQDVEAVELPQVDKRRQFCCGPCVEKLLSAKAEVNIDAKPPKSHRAPVRPGPRFSKWASK